MFYKIALVLLIFSRVDRVFSQGGQCGVPSKSTGLIVKGSNYDRGTWPWTVALIKRSKGVGDEQKFFCGGVLVSSTKVVTAAHCIQPKEQRTKNLARDILIFFGVHDLNNRNENGVYSVSPFEIVMHPDWNPFNGRYDADIAVITLEDAVPYTIFIRPICIASNDINPNEGFVTGWGQSEDESKVHENIPKELKAPIWTNEHCFLESSEFSKLASRRTFCAGSRDGTGVCRGDSGGGMFVKSSGVYFLHGIISASLLKDGTCDVSNFALYTNVNKFIAWIDVPIEHQTALSGFRNKPATCGVMSSTAGLIQNGIKSKAVQWPWAVVIFNKGYQAVIDNDTYSDFEIGTLLSERHVIGDGMFFSKEVDGKRVPISTDAIKSFFGVINLDDYASSNSLVLDGAEKISLHPDFGNIHSLKFANFAVIKMKTPVTFSQFISPICLSSFNGDPYEMTGKFGYAVGMGYSETGKTKDRKHSPMRIRNKETCDVEFKFNLGTAKNRNLYFCAGGDGRSNGCWSDHPFYMKTDERWYLHAFMQVAYNHEKGCSSTLPVLYELAGPYHTWIQKEIGSG